jgi:uncharacterized alpha-E superfamily protein
MLSRVANSLYWLSRYLERVENLTRLVEVNRYESLDSSDPDQWRPLLYTTCTEKIFEGSEEGDVGMFIYFSEDNPDSIRECVAHARENARMVRDQISEEIWRELNRFHLFIRSENAVELWQNQPEAFHRRTIEFCMLLSGLIHATVLHDEGWHFMQIGKLIERADKTTRVLDMLAYQGITPRTKLASALKSCSAFNAFQAEYRSGITLDHAMSFLLFSSSFPRSVRFCIKQLDHHLHAVSGSPIGSYTNEAERINGSALAQLNFSSSLNVLQIGYHDYIDSLQKQFNEIGQQVFDTYILLPLEIRSNTNNGARRRLNNQQGQQQQ